MLGIRQFDVSMRRVAWLIAAPTLLALTVMLLLGTPAGAIFSSPSRLSEDGVKAAAPRIATDSHNNALIVWSEGESGAHRIQAAFRPAGGDATPIGFLSAESGDALEPTVVFDEHDNALVVWTTYEGPTDNAFGRVQAAFRPAGGSFGPAQTISGTEPGVDHYAPHVDIDESAAVVWARAAGEQQTVEASFRAKDGSFGAPQTLSGAGYASEPQVVVDERGNSLAVWTEETTDGAPFDHVGQPSAHGWLEFADRRVAGGRRSFLPAARCRRAQQRDRHLGRGRRRRQRPGPQLHPGGATAGGRQLRRRADALHPVRHGIRPAARLRQARQRDRGVGPGRRPGNPHRGVPRAEGR